MPFLIHSPTTQGGPTGPGTNDNNNGNNPGTTSPGDDDNEQTRNSLQDLLNALGSCPSNGHEGSKMSGYPRSLQAKVEAAMRSEHSTRTDHHLSVLQHQLDTPAAEKHASACIDELRDLIGDLMTSS